MRYFLTRNRFSFFSWQGQSFFPDFAWALDNTMVVRGGQLLTPATQYLDTETSDVRLLMTLYGVDSKASHPSVGIVFKDVNLVYRASQRHYSERGHVLPQLMQKVILMDIVPREPLS
jgi:hypothetical protein